MEIYNKINILKKIGWYQDAEIEAHEKLTNLFNCMVDYFNKNNMPNDIIVGGFYPVNPQLTFSTVVKRAHRFIEPSEKSIDQTYTAYYNYLSSPKANLIVKNIKILIEYDELDFRLVDGFIAEKYGYKI